MAWLRGGGARVGPDRRMIVHLDAPLPLGEVALKAPGAAFERAVTHGVITGCVWRARVVTGRHRRRALADIGDCRTPADVGEPAGDRTVVSVLAYYWCGSAEGSVSDLVFDEITDAERTAGLLIEGTSATSLTLSPWQRRRAVRLSRSPRRGWLSVRSVVDDESQGRARP